jgi:general secretion pathway protein B
MSSILKALKKLEQSKSVRRGSDHDMTWFIRGDTGESVPRRRWPLFLALLGVAAAAAVATYGVMTKFSGPLRPERAGQSMGKGTKAAGSRQPSPERAVAVPRAASPVQEAVKPSVAAGSLRTSGAKSGHGVPLPDETLKTRPFPGALAPKGTVRQISPSGPNQRKLPARGSASPSAPVTPPAGQAVSPEHPVLQVGGIAWQKDSASPMAIVNGTPVAEGSTVGGARVEKIYPERVRFSHKGRTFDVGLGSSSNGR